MKKVSVVFAYRVLSTIFDGLGTPYFYDGLDHVLQGLRA